MLSKEYRDRIDREDREWRARTDEQNRQWREGVRRENRQFLLILVLLFLLVLAGSIVTALIPVWLG